MKSNNKFMDFFDEKKGIWIKIYKWAVIVVFFLLILTTFVMAIVVAAQDPNTTDGLTGVGGFFSVLLSGALSTFFWLVVNMLLINALNNLQEIKVSNAQMRHLMFQNLRKKKSKLKLWKLANNNHLRLITLMH